MSQAHRMGPRMGRTRTYLGRIFFSNCILKNTAYIIYIYIYHRSLYFCVHSQKKHIAATWLRFCTKISHTRLIQHKKTESVWTVYLQECMADWLLCSIWSWCQYRKPLPVKVPELNTLSHCGGYCADMVAVVTFGASQYMCDLEREPSSCNCRPDLLWHLKRKA